MDDCPKEYLSFQDTEEEMLEEYNTGTSKRVIMPDGTLKFPWDEEFQVHVEGRPAYEITHIVPDDLEQREIPIKDIYATFEDFATEYHGCKERDSETHRYGYWENPNRKWDWYQIGGRWTGFYKLKAGVDGLLGTPGLMTPVAEEGHADQTMVGDIDIEAMRSEAGDKAREKYRALAGIFGGSIPRLKFTWTEVRFMKNLDIEQQRAFYHDQEPIKIIQEAKKNENTWPEVLDKWFFDIEDFACTEEEFVQQHRDSALAPFAFVKDGKWFERGKMGWWAFVSDEKDKGQWDREFNILMDSLAPNTLLTLVDCHI